MSSFSNYGKIHGNKFDWTGIIVTRDDVVTLAKHGFTAGTPLSAEGFVGPNGTEFLLSKHNPKDALRVFDRREGKLIFGVSPEKLRLRTTSTHERPLTHRDSVHVSNLIATARNGKVYLVSTGRSKFGSAKTRNSSARSKATSITEGNIAAEQEADVFARPVKYKQSSGLIMRWGTDLALRLPPELANEVGLVEGSRVAIEPLDHGRILVAKSSRRFALKELLELMAPEREPPIEDDGARGEEII